jgi:hypothetical protein
MSDSGSDPAFVEDDAKETKLGYGAGKVPVYVIAAWVLFLVVYVVAMSLLALPDLRAWNALVP